MIDILGPVTAAAHGGCIECDPNDDRGDDLYVFQLGAFKIRLCRSHVAMLEQSLGRALKKGTGRLVDVALLEHLLSASIDD